MRQKKSTSSTKKRSIVAGEAVLEDVHHHFRSCSQRSELEAILPSPHKHDLELRSGEDGSVVRVFVRGPRCSFVERVLHLPSEVVSCHSLRSDSDARFWSPVEVVIADCSEFSSHALVLLCSREEGKPKIH